MIGSRDYVPHSRYGTGPRYTGYDPDPAKEQVLLHWNTIVPKSLDTEYVDEEVGVAIPGTAIAADLDQQTESTRPVTHYYDLERQCDDCERWFIFYAVEQKHWYEKLGFGLDSDCIHCPECRKERQALQRKRFRYEELQARDDLDRDEAFELARCRLELVAAGVFGFRQLDRVRQVLNRYPDDPESPALRSALDQVVAKGEPEPRRVKGRRRDAGDEPSE